MLGELNLPPAKGSEVDVGNLVRLRWLRHLEVAISICVWLIEWYDK